MINNNLLIASATSKYIKVSPTKINKILLQIRQKKYNEALNILKYIPQRGGTYVWKTLYSAISNGINNLNFNKDNIYIVEARVNKGAILKRSRPRARGKSFPIQKKLSHITIKVKEF